MTFLVLLSNAVVRASKNIGKSNGAEGIRTPGLVNASHALCQLSYSPIIELKWYEIEFTPVKESVFLTVSKFDIRQASVVAFDPYDDKLKFVVDKLKFVGHQDAAVFG